MMVLNLHIDQGSRIIWIDWIESHITLRHFAPCCCFFSFSFSFFSYPTNQTDSSSKSTIDRYNFFSFFCFFRCRFCFKHWPPGLDQVRFELNVWRFEIMDGCVKVDMFNESRGKYVCMDLAGQILGYGSSSWVDDQACGVLDEWMRTRCMTCSSFFFFFFS